MVCRLLFLLIFISTNLCAAAKENPNTQKKIEGKVSQKELLSLLPDDKFLGDIKAPILMIEYASLTCYHCSLFHKNIFPKIKKKYIDTGKMLYVFRHFPLDYCALKAAMLSYCYDKQEDYFNFNKAIFDSIDSWNYSNPKDLTLLRSVAKLSNLKKDKFDHCINNEEVMNKIITIKSQVINKFSIAGTPVFFIKPNDNKEYRTYDRFKHEGYKKLEYFTSVIDELYKRATIQ